jgi:hypothetical protein
LRPNYSRQGATLSKSQETESVSIRVPREIKDWLEREAAHNFRSQNAQVLAILKERMDQQAADKVVH